MVVTTTPVPLGGADPVPEEPEELEEPELSAELDILIVIEMVSSFGLWV